MRNDYVLPIHYGVSHNTVLIDSEVCRCKVKLRYCRLYRSMIDIIDRILPHWIQQYSNAMSLYVLYVELSPTKLSTHNALGNIIID